MWQEPLQEYTGGVFAGNCSDEVDDMMLLVADSEHAWKLKNDWSSSWGDHGYLELAKGVAGAGECGITVSAFQPVLAERAVSGSDWTAQAGPVRSAGQCTPPGAWPLVDALAAAMQISG